MTRLSYSTLERPASSKLSYWNDLIDDVLTPLEAKPRERASFEAVLQCASFGAVQIAHPMSGPGRVEHSKAHVLRTQGRKFFLHMSLNGSFQAQSADKEAVVSEGDLLLYDSAEPYSLDYDSPVSMLIAAIPEELARRQLCAPADAIGVCIDGKRGFGRTLSLMFRGIWDASQEELAPALCAKVADDFLSVLATACAAEGIAPTETATRTARRMQVRRYIYENLKDPALSASTVAARMGISRRYLHLLFGAEDETVSSYILQRRLEACAKQLSDPCLRRRSITEIAFEWGFNHATHFARVFKARYGVAPRDYRLVKLSHAAAH